MRVLIVSQYFPPEPGATQNRLGTFAEGLVARGHAVTVVCEQPNHPSGVFHPGFGRRPLHTERSGELTVRRTWVAASPVKSTTRRLAFYSTFAAGAAATVLFERRHDVCFASSPPLPGVLAVAEAARLKRTPLVVDVRDVWPAAAEALGELTNRRVISAFERAEARLYRQARTVTATTRPFCAHIDAIAPGKAVHLPNGALDELIALPDSEPPDGPFTVGYAGNLGIAQGLGIVVDAARRLPDVRFVLVGDGPVRSQLVDPRVEIRPPVPVTEVAAFLQSCHALLVPLRDHSVLGDFIPSKLYDAMAIGRPALVAARGEAAALVAEAGAGIAVAPEDGAALAQAITTLRNAPEQARAYAANGRRAAREHARSRQVERLETVLASVC